MRLELRKQTGLLRLAITGVLLGMAWLFVPPGHADDKPDFSRWEKAIAAFEDRDREKPPPKNAILFVGSSSIHFWDLPKSFPDMDVINRGFGGSQIRDSVHFAPRIVVKNEPRLVVFYAGDNDIALGKDAEQVAADFRAFVKVVHKQLPKTKIAFLSIKPSLQRWSLWDKMQKANSLIEAECKKDGRLIYVDVAKPMLGDDGKPRPDLLGTDGLHLNAKGYEVWAATLKPYLK